MVKTSTPRLQSFYQQKIIPHLMQKWPRKKVMAIPKLTKIVLSMGVGRLAKDSKKLEQVGQEFALIAGQKPLVVKAKKSISSFNIRQGMPSGLKITLRGKRMYEFLDRFVNIALPRTRDFRGINAKSFDGNGNFAFGVREHIIFPEIDYDKVDKIRGFDIIICSNTHDDEEARVLLACFNLPIYGYLDEGGKLWPRKA